MDGDGIPNNDGVPKLNDHQPGCRKTKRFPSRTETLGAIVSGKTDDGTSEWPQPCVHNVQVRRHLQARGGGV